MSATMTGARLSEGVRELLATLADYESARAVDGPGPASSAAVDELTRRLAVIRALWVAAESGDVPADHLLDVVRLVREERDWATEDEARQRDDLQTFIIREDPGLRYADDRGETIAMYLSEIARRRQAVERCDEFLAAVTA
jgi:hypothetical protein